MNSDSRAPGDSKAIIRDAYAGILDEVRSTEYSAGERAMLSDPIFYYGRFPDPRTRGYALDSVVANVDHAIKYLAPGRSGIRILDLGCGLGMQSLIFARYGATVVGVDLDPQCTTLAEKRRAFFEQRWGTALRTQFIAADFHDFAGAYQLETFDAGFSMSAFAHIPPLERTVAEISGLARPSARVFLWDKNPDYLFLNHVAPSVGEGAGLPRPIERSDALLRATGSRLTAGPGAAESQARSGAGPQ
jgi:2-polyprenyl-3-methyl-5-hydroxy-6-metoxy-1,4-benzoquinol methylase